VADRVLIVEDNEALRVGIRLSLEDAGYTVQEAATGEEAVRKLETEPCHVVITDIRHGVIRRYSSPRRSTASEYRLHPR
jgi:CheY-like chemotaxis protein